MVAALIAALVATSAHKPVVAQEMSAAGYIGALEGAIQACSAAFPQHAADYAKTVRRSVHCELSDAQFEQWLLQLRTKPADSAAYAQGFKQGRASLSKLSRNAAAQCATLRALRCALH